MTTNLSYLNEKVNLLTLSGVTLIHMDEVDAWLYAIDLAPSERKAACLQILSDGSYTVSNIEHRVTVECKQ